VAGRLHREGARAVRIARSASLLRPHLPAFTSSPRVQPPIDHGDGLASLSRFAYRRIAQQRFQFLGRLPITGAGMDESPGERRGKYDRREVARVTRCDQCHAHLVVDRRRNAVRLFSATTYQPTQQPTSTSEPVPRCPLCLTPLRPTETK
jgi:hypothetical protein